MKIGCHECEHYYVTWDKHFPYGCKAMKFKSAQLPIAIVRSSTPDLTCLSFRKKERATPSPSPK